MLLINRLRKTTKSTYSRQLSINKKQIILTPDARLEFIFYQEKHMTKIKFTLAMVAVFMSALFGISGCDLGSYNNCWLYPEDVTSVYVEMFDSQSFRRGHGYTLTDAIAKRIEAETPYKIVSDRDLADTLLSGKICSIGSRILAMERETGRSMEHEAMTTVMVTWKNLNTGEILVDNETVSASASYSQFLGNENNRQDFDYAADVAINRAAERVVELMQVKWE